MSPNRCGLSSCSRSPTPHQCRRPRSCSRSPRCRSSTRNRYQRLFEADQRLLRLCNLSPVPQLEDDLEADQNSSADDSRMSAEAVRRLFAKFVCPPALSHYADPYPSTDLTNTQLVPYTKDAATSKSARDGEDLDTHDDLFQNYQSFHRLSGDQNREARTSAYHELINLLLSQMTEDKQVINVSAACPKWDCPFHGNLETPPEL